MPIFKRSPEPDEQPPDASKDAPMLSEDELLDHVGRAIAEAEQDGHPFAVLSVIAQVLSGGRLHPGEMDFASTSLASMLRSSDVLCALGEGALVALLHTDEAGARVVAHRIAADLAVRSYAGMRRKWLTGVALFPLNGGTAADLVQTAIDQAN